MTGLLVGHREFRRFALAFLVSRGGDYLLSVGMVVFVFERTGSTAWVATAAILRVVPNMLLSAAGGGLGTRFGLRFLVLSDVTRSALNVGLTVAAMVGSLPAVLLLSVCSQIVGAGYSATAAGMVSRLVASNKTAAANATISAIESVSLLAGPSIAGLLMAFTSPVTAFGLNAGSFLASALVVGRLRLRPDHPCSPVTEEASDGLGAAGGWAFRVLVSDRRLRGVAVGVVASSLLVGVLSVAFVLLALQLGAGLSGAGYLMAAFGAGGVLGALAASRWLDRLTPVVWASGLLVTTGTAAVALALVRVPLPGLLLTVLLGATTGFLDILAVTQVQRVAPRTTGAICGALDSLAQGAVLLGLLLTPALVSAVGVTGTLTLIGATLVLLAPVALPANVLKPRPERDRQEVRQ